MTFIANPNMDRMRSKILKALGNGKKMGLSDLAAAIGETNTQTNSVIRSLRNKGKVIQEGGGRSGIKALYSLSGSEEEKQRWKEEEERLRRQGIWQKELDATRKRIKEGECLRIPIYGGKRVDGGEITVYRVARVVSKHRRLVRLSDGHDATYEELAVYYRGKRLDWR